MHTGMTNDLSPRRTQDRQGEMLAAVDVGMWYCDLPFDELQWDRKVKEHFWLPPHARVTIETFYARIHPDDRERTRAAIERSIAEHAPYDIEYRTVAPPDAPEAGAVRWVRAIGYTGYDGDGRPVRFDGVTVDVTAQKRAAEALAASEQRYEYAARATSNAIWDWDLVGDGLTWNEGVYTVFGYAPGTVSEGVAWWYASIHPDDRERIVADIRAVIDGADGGHAWLDEYRFRRADGTYAWVVDRGYVARDAAGRAVRMIGAMEDVTGRRQAEEQLRRSEERFRSLVEATSAIAWTTPASGAFEWDQPAWRAFTGQRPEEAQGAGWLDAVHPDDRATMVAEWEAALRDGSTYESEHRVRRHDGVWRHFWVRAIPIREADGSIREWVGTHTDVTQELLAQQAIAEEAQLVTTLQRIGSTLAAELELERIVQTVTDESTQLTGAQFGAFFYNVLNEKGESYTLYTISGVPREHFSKFPMPRNTHVFAPTFKGEGVVRSDDITKDPRYGKMAPHFGMPKGHLPVVSYLAVPVKSHSGEVIGGLFFGHPEPGVFSARHEQLVEGIASWAAVAMDNARLYQSERSSRAAAEEANRAKSEFLARMSHDLRTPLNAIGGYAQLMELGVHGPVTEGQTVSLGRIRRAQEHLLTLINDILSFATLEAGQVRVVLEDVPVRPVVEELTALVRPDAAARGLELESHTGADGLCVRADRARLMQIVGSPGTELEFAL